MTDYELKSQERYWILFFLTIDQNEITIENADNSIRGLTNRGFSPFHWKHCSKRNVGTFDPPPSTEAKIVLHFAPSSPWNASSFAWPVRNRHRFDIPSRRTFRISRSTRLHIRSIRTEPNDFIPLLKFSNGFDFQLWFLVTSQRFKHASTRWTKIQDYCCFTSNNFQMISHFLKIIHRSLNILL